LRAALRQAPKVILVGEIRDRESMEIALTASETGHLVFSTLHTISAGQTINRVLGMFGKEEEKQVRERMAETLRYVISQRLVSKTGGGRLLITEIMGSSLRTRESLIYGEGENRTFLEIIEAGDIHGWHSFDQSLLKAYDAADIDEETAVIFATHKTKMRRDIEMSRKMRFDYAEESSGLQMSTDP
jgi:twitching motility protein PilT